MDTSVVTHNFIHAILDTLNSNNNVKGSKIVGQVDVQYEDVYNPSGGKSWRINPSAVARTMQVGEDLVIDCICK
jgi:hypothetical protein